MYFNYIEDTLSLLLHIKLTVDLLLVAELEISFKSYVYKLVAHKFNRFAFVFQLYTN